MAMPTSYCLREERCAGETPGAVCRCLRGAAPESCEGADSLANTGAARQAEAARASKSKSKSSSSSNNAGADGATADADAVFTRGWPERLDGRAEELAAQLFAAVEDGDLAGIARCAQEGAGLFAGRKSILNARRSHADHDFPLSVAASMDDVDAMRTLLELGACMRCQSSRNESALHTAALMGRERAVHFLLDAGATDFCHSTNLEGATLADQLLLEVADVLAGQETPDELCQAQQRVACALLDRGARAQSMALDAAARCTHAMEPALAQRVEYHSAREGHTDHCAAVFSVYLHPQDHESKYDCGGEDGGYGSDDGDYGSAEGGGEAKEMTARDEEETLRVDITSPIPAVDTACRASPPRSVSPRKRFIGSHRRVVVSSPLSAPAPSKGLHRGDSDASLEAQVGDQRSDVQRLDVPEGSASPGGFTLPTLHRMK